MISRSAKPTTLAAPLARSSGWTTSRRSSKSEQSTPDSFWNGSSWTCAELRLSKCAPLPSTSSALLWAHAGTAVSVMLPTPVFAQKWPLQLALIPPAEMAWRSVRKALASASMSSLRMLSTYSPSTYQTQKRSLSLLRTWMATRNLKATSSTLKDTLLLAMNHNHWSTLTWNALFLFLTSCKNLSTTISGI